LRAVLVVEGGRWVGPFIVENLSTGGALIAGSMVHLARFLCIGVEIGVRLHLPGESDVLELRATIVRPVEEATPPEGFAIAVEFKEVTAEHQNMIEAALARAMEASRTDGT